MKNIFITIVLLLSLNNVVNAQAWDGKGDTKISIGYEFYAHNPINNNGDNGHGFVSTIDYGILDNISMGVGVDYNFSSTNFYLNLRSDYHFQQFLELSSNFDIYAGGDIGLNTYYSNDWDFGIHGGMRLMFSDAIGIYLELGNRGNAGITYNF